MNILAEDDNTYTVEGPGGNPIRIAKPGLSDGMRDRVQGLVAPPPEPPPAVRYDDIPPEVRAEMMGGVDVPPEAQASPAPVVEPPSDVRFEALPESVRAEMMGDVPVRRADPADGVPPPAPAPTPATPRAPAPKAPAPTVPGTSFSTEAPAQAQPTRPSVPTDPVEAARQEAEEVAAAKQTYDQTLRERQWTYEQTRAGLQERARRFEEDIQKGSIDPNRLWSRMDTGQRVGATIGLILGGIGGALTRQPNAALNILQRSIDRDLEAQQNDLGKKENLLTSYWRAVGDADTAHSLAKADLASATAAQIDAISARYSPGRAAAQADHLAKQMRAEADRLRDEAALRAVDVDFARRDRLSQIRLREAQTAKLNQPAQSSDSPYRTLQTEKLLDEKKVRERSRSVMGVLLQGPVPQDEIDEVLPYLSDRVAERVVQVQDAHAPTSTDGKAYLAKSRKAAEELVGVNNAYKNVMATFNEYDRLHNKHEYGWFGANRADAASAKKYWEQLRVTIAKMYEPTGVLTDRDLERYSKMLPDITDSNLVFGKTSQLMKEIREGLAERYANAVSTRVHGYQRPSAQSATVRVQHRATGRVDELPRHEAARYLADPAFVEVQ